MKCYAGMCCAAHDAAGCVAYTEAEKNQGVCFRCEILMKISFSGGLRAARKAVVALRPGAMRKSRCVDQFPLVSTGRGELEIDEYIEPQRRFRNCCSSTGKMPSDGPLARDPPPRKVGTTLRP